MKIKNCFEYVKIFICQWNRKHIIMPEQTKKLKNYDFSVIASNCNGCVICSDLGVRFNSPTVNLSMSAKDYIKFVTNMDYYLNADIEEKKISSANYPVGILGGDITLHFMHYATFEQAVRKWNQRKKRIRYDNLFFMMTDRDGCTEEDIKIFNELPFKNKMIFTAKAYPQYESAVFCEEFKEEKTVPIMSEWRNIKGERLYDRYFDFVGWFNGNTFESCKI